MQPEDPILTGEQPIDGTALPPDSGQPPDSEGDAPPTGEVDLHSLVGELVASNAEVLEALGRTQGQASRAEREVLGLGPRIDGILAAIGQRAAPDAVAELGEIDDPVLAHLVRQQQEMSRTIQGLHQERQQDRQRVAVNEARAYGMRELEKIAGLAEVDFDSIVSALGELSDAELWQEGTKLIAKAKAVAKKPKAPKPRARETEQQEGRYTERPGGAPSRRSTKKANIEDAYADGNITTKQYEDQMTAIGAEP